ncbi:hypothetical protein LXA43DRAFT_739369 [Ganoderma leucocontextum]|nr:hypothetical protein LXA43DRAFT_739369 [Ganoderma leucocontextum]
MVPDRLHPYNPRLLWKPLIKLSFKSLYVQETWGPVSCHVMVRRYLYVCTPARYAITQVSGSGLASMLFDDSTSTDLIVMTLDIWRHDQMTSTERSVSGHQLSTLSPCPFDQVRLSCSWAEQYPTTSISAKSFGSTMITNLSTHSRTNTVTSPHPRTIRPLTRVVHPSPRVLTLLPCEPAPYTSCATAPVPRRFPDIVLRMLPHVPPPHTPRPTGRPQRVHPHRACLSLGKSMSNGSAKSSHSSHEKHVHRTPGTRTLKLLLCRGTFPPCAHPIPNRDANIGQRPVSVRHITQSPLPPGSAPLALFVITVGASVACPSRGVIFASLWRAGPASRDVGGV